MVGQVVERLAKRRIVSLYGVLLCVLSLQVTPQSVDDNYQESIASKMGRKFDKVPARIPREEYLWTCAGV